LFEDGRMAPRGRPRKADKTTPAQKAHFASMVDGKVRARDAKRAAWFTRNFPGVTDSVIKWNQHGRTPGGQRRLSTLTDSQEARAVCSVLNIRPLGKGAEANITAIVR
ncbi:hypothetical protein PMAYCL1PPCAC_01420, partial [Pristionchus mayeri]